MPDQGTVESVARKFEAWAQSLSPDERETLAEWWGQIGSDDVEAHSSIDWWNEPGTWSRAWSDSWSWA